MNDGEILPEEETFVQSSRAPVNDEQRSRGENLDDMMGDLQQDMNKHGVMVIPKGHCSACMKPIVGQVEFLKYL